MPRLQPTPSESLWGSGSRPIGYNKWVFLSNTVLNPCPHSVTLLPGRDNLYRYYGFQQGSGCRYRG